MANPEHLAKIKEGVEAWNARRDGNPQIVPDLRDANLGKADLSGADFSEADLSGAEFVGADLVGAYLRGANLFGTDLRANLSGANLSMANVSWALVERANLSRANLVEANLQMSLLTEAHLTGADLSGAILSRADLSGADLTEASIAYTTFGDNDLSDATGLESAKHGGPSTIGIDTIYRSRGKIPEPFLRGCGVPEDFIAYARSLAINPIQFYSCFISYSTKDQDFADRLYADLQNKGVRCWFAPHDVQGGRKLHEQIDEAIRLHDKLLLILSPHSMESEWVKTEIAKARRREVRDQRRVLFPIRLAPFETLRDWECFDADTGKDSAREIREYFIPDFSNWKDHDSYQEAFQRLISDLKASDTKPK
jgi:uncharacterized protein YjbI with pentapeptide repeats